MAQERDPLGTITGTSRATNMTRATPYLAAAIAALTFCLIANAFIAGLAAWLAGEI